MPITPPKRNKFTIQNTKYTFPFTNSPSTITYTKFTVHYHIHQIHHPKKTNTLSPRLLSPLQNYNPPSHISNLPSSTTFTKFTIQNTKPNDRPEAQSRNEAKAAKPSQNIRTGFCPEKATILCFAFHKYLKQKP